jgi:hypothetical protein
LRELVRQIEGERDDLRRRLDRETEERRKTQIKLTALLTHQPGSKADTPSLAGGPRRRPPVAMGCACRCQRCLRHCAMAGLSLIIFRIFSTAEFDDLGTFKHPLFLQFIEVI